VIEGAADEPVTLSIVSGEATIEPASDLRGLDAAETDARFSEAAVACVGPAGEAGGSGTRRSPPTAATTTRAGAARAR